MQKILLTILLLFTTLNNVNANNYFYSKNKQVIFKRSNFGALKGWNNEEYRYALASFLISCGKFNSISKNSSLIPQINEKITTNSILNICKIAEKIANSNNEIIKVFFENYFVPYLVYDNNKKTNKGSFTGYYLPEINVSFKKTKRFKFPIYARPNNLNYTRKQIDNGALNNKNLELLYTDDLVELFFFHIQGSGYGKLFETGELINISFDGKTNYEYTSIGTFLRKNNLLNGDQLNAMGIKKYLKNSQPQVEKILQENKSYIFFKIVKEDYIVGSQGVKLNSLVSLAVDKSLIPLGFPIWLETEITTKNKKNINFKKLMVTQDTGSAIKGAIRGDIFFGAGKDAEEYASYQHGVGQYYILIPIDVEREIFKNKY